jgi:riboflavin-specific deaminase-like protein
MVETLDAGAWSRVLAVKAGADADAPAGSLEAVYAMLARPPGEPIVFGQVGQSLDGRVATPSGDARDVSSAEGLVHLHRCRALADAVIVGVGTVVADDPQLTVRLVEGEHPLRVVIDPAGRMPATARLLRDGIPTVIVCADGCRRDWPVETIQLTRHDGRLRPGDIVAALARRGLKRLLVEGGASTLASFIEAGVLDRLHVTVAPLIIGSGPCGLSLAPIDRLSQAVRPKVSVYSLGQDMLFDCDFRG